MTYNGAVVPGALDEIDQVRLGAEKVQMQHGRAQTGRHLVTFAVFNIVLLALIPAVQDNRQLSTWLFYVRDRRLADGDVHCAASATYQIFLGYRSRTLTRSLTLNPNRKINKK